MYRNDIEPLETSLWFDHVGKLLKRVHQENKDDCEPLLRKAFYLLQLTPTPIKGLLPCSVREETVEAYLGCGAYLSAALALLKDAEEVTLSRGTQSGAYTAAVTFGRSACGEASDREPAKALLGAWCKAALSLSVTPYEPVQLQDGTSSSRSLH